VAKQGLLIKQGGIYKVWTSSSSPVERQRIRNIMLCRISNSGGLCSWDPHSATTKTVGTKSVSSFAQRSVLQQNETSPLFLFSPKLPLQALGIISLEYCTGLRLVEDSKTKRSFCFEINCPDRIYLIQAPSSEERVDWMQAIEDAVPEIMEEVSHIALQTQYHPNIDPTLSF